MATAWPVHAMSTGVGNERSRSASSKPPRSMADASEPPPLSTARSNPAENRPSLPVSTTTARSAVARSRAAPSSVSI